MIGKKVNKALKCEKYMSNNQGENIISFKNITVYDRNKVYKNINIDIHKGEIKIYL
ncbi:hypothetical protein [Romboutsia sp.]|uniref:hypothetical protein n=1 Tax=Romboutsia sp. TaxID=1965302 RepID=UPI003F3488DC